MARPDSHVYHQWWKHPMRVFRHWRQRAQRGFSVYDTWSLDRHLAGVIAHSVAHLRDHTHGYPGEEGMTKEKWHAILTEIETPLRVWAELAHDMDPSEEDRWVDRCEKSLELFKEYFFGLWD